MRNFQTDKDGKLAVGDNGGTRPSSLSHIIKDPSPCARFMDVAEWEREGLVSLLLTNIGLSVN